MDASPTLRTHVAIAALSASLLAFQLALMQLFGLVQWHHYAYLVISIALMGFGASGSIFALLRDRMLAARTSLFPALASLCAVLMILTTGAALLTSSGFDPFLLFTDTRHVGRLLGTCILLFLPFVPGALVLVLAFATWPQHIGSLYRSNLAGSAAGGILALLLPWLLSPEHIPSGVALLAVLASAFLLPSSPRGSVLIPAMALLLCLLSIVLQPDAKISEYKSLSRTLDLPDAEVLLEANSPAGMLHVVRAPALRHAPGLSLTYRGSIPARDALFRDGNMLGVLTGKSSEKHPEEGASVLLDWTTRALPYALGRAERVLVLEAGAGEEVAQAVDRGAALVTALQPDARLRSLLYGSLARMTDSLFHHPGVRMLPRDARSVLASEGRYDLIVHPVVESMGGSAGLHALQEEYTLTVEAFEAMWQRLSPRGRIEVTVWMDYPWRSPLRLCATLATMLERVGFSPRHHLIAVRGWGMLTFVVTRFPVTGEHAVRTREFCERLQFDPALLPDLRPEETARYHGMGEKGFFRTLETLLGSGRDAYIESYPFRIAPATDDRPFFSQFLTPASLRVIGEDAGRAGIPAMELGSVTVLATVATVILLSIVFIIVPLLPRRMRGKRRGWAFLHFATIGTGFFFVEILLLHAFVLYFGNPVYAAAGVITALLLSAGFGSRLSERLQPGWRALVLTCTAIALLIGSGAFIWQALLASTVAASPMMKVLIGLLLILPAGLLMGMPFPLGIRILGDMSPGIIPWAWAVNGCFSVISTGLATLLALEFGFSVVLLAASILYAGAAAAALLLRFPRKNKTG
ncbi:MAG: spermidine synthase-like protein [Bacteroidetes bacterium]|nr:spermidine synthase-like protein [Bacteroidota bacterium]